MNIETIIQLAVSLLTLLCLVWVMISRVKDPDAKASEKIAILKEQFLSTDKELKLIRENHLSHIERDITFLKEGQVKLFTILEERLPNK